MKAVVVYESLWGNTAEIARGIAQGIGPEVVAVSTAGATEEVIAGADLIVAGAPVHGFRLPAESGRKGLGAYEKKAPEPPDLSHPPLRTWLEALPEGHGRAAAFETGFRWSPGGATKKILKLLQRAGYARVEEKGRRFLIEGSYGPLSAGELDRARQWGAELADKLASGGVSGSASSG